MVRKEDQIYKELQPEALQAEAFVLIQDLHRAGLIWCMRQAHLLRSAVSTSREACSNSIKPESVRVPE